MQLKSQKMRKLAPELDPLRIGTGWTKEDLGKVQVIVESTYGDSHPGSGHLLELTWLRDWEKDHYDLGDNEFHLAFTVDDFEAAHAKHQEMGCICFENEKMGIYFITDPDEYWLEIVPVRK